MGCGDHDMRVANSWKQEITPISKTFFDKYSAAYEVDREKMGFTVLPTTGSVKVETILRTTWAKEYPPPVYDVMLHFYDRSGGTSYKHQARTVALKKVEGRLVWISEQLSFYGPKQYTTSDGTFNESITITSEKEQVVIQGMDLKGTSIMYSGPDSRLAIQNQHADNLTIDQITPILKEWGYHYNINNAQPKDALNSNSAAAKLE